MTSHRLARLRGVDPSALGGVASLCPDDVVCEHGCTSCCRRVADEAPVVLSEDARTLLRRLLLAHGEAVEVVALDAKVVTELDERGLVAIYRGYVCARGVKP